jgi:hypothetical protein
MPGSWLNTRFDDSAIGAGFRIEAYDFAKVLIGIPRWNINRMWFPVVT